MASPGPSVSGSVVHWFTRAVELMEIGDKISP